MELFKKGKDYIKYLYYVISFCFITIFKVSKLLFVGEIFNEALMTVSSIVKIWAFKEVINTLIEILINKQSNFNIFVFWIAVYIITDISYRLLNEIFNFIISFSRRKVERYIDCILVDKVISMEISFFDSPNMNDRLNIINEYKS